MSGSISSMASDTFHLSSGPQPSFCQISGLYGHEGAIVTEKVHRGVELALPASMAWGKSLHLPEPVSSSTKWDQYHLLCTAIMETLKQK